MLEDDEMIIGSDKFHLKYRFDIFVLSDISYSRISIGVIVDLSLSIKRMFPFRGYNYLLTIVCLLFLTQAKL